MFTGIIARRGRHLAILAGVVIFALAIVTAYQKFANRIEPANVGGSSIHRAPIKLSKSKIDLTAPSPPEDAFDSNGGAVLSAADEAVLRRLEELAKSDSGSTEADSTQATLDRLRGWAKKAPEVAAEWVITHLDGYSRARCLEEVIGNWATSNPQDAITWLDARSDSEGLEGAISAALSAFTDEDPAAAAAWLDGRPDSASLDNWSIVLGLWAEVDAPAAVRHACDSLPKAMKEALMPVMLASMRNPADARTLLHGSSSKVAAAAIQEGIGASMHAAPPYAMELAQLLDDAADREEATKRILAEWEKEQPAEAASWTSGKR